MTRILLSSVLAFAVVAAHAGAQSVPDGRSLAPQPSLRPAELEPVKTAVPQGFQPTRQAATPLDPAKVAAPRAPGATPFGRPRGLAVVDRPGADEPVWFLGDGFKGFVDGDRVRFLPFLGADAPREFPLELRLLRVRVGGVEVPVGAGEPAYAGRRIEVRRPGVVEYFDVTPAHLEQSFRFDTLPARGELVVELALATELEPEVVAGGLRFAAPRGHVDYVDGVAIDARGARCPVAIGLEGGIVQLRVPAEFVAAATLPLVVDPTVIANTIAQSAADLWEPDITWNRASGEYLATWAQPFSGVDLDVYAQRLDDNMIQIGAPIAIDFTSRRWDFPRVACRPSTDDCLVVAQVSSGNVAPFWIAGRRIAGTQSGGNMSAQFDIERDGVVGLAGNDYHPDVGSDEYPGTYSVFYTVVWEHESSPGNRDIHLKRIDWQGNLASTMPQVVSSSYRDEANPAISGFDGESNTTIGLWGVVWESVYSQTDHDILFASVGLTGSVVSGPFYINASLANETRPRISSYSTSFGGSRYFMAVYEHDSNYTANVGRVYGTVFSPNGAVLVTADLNALDGAPANWPQWTPAVDCDGCRFAVTYTELYGGGGSDLDARVSMFAFDPATHTITAQDPRVTLGFTSDPEQVLAIVAKAAASGAPSVRYGTVQRRQYVSSQAAYPHGLEAVAYDGCTPGGGYVLRPAGCGGLSLTHGVQPPAVGTFVELALGSSGFPRGLLVGWPMPLVPMGPCPNCSFGVASPVAVPTPYSLQIPYSPAFVGARLSAQGWAAGGGPCLGTFVLSDVCDIVIR